MKNCPICGTQAEPDGQLQCVCDINPFTEEVCPKCGYPWELHDFGVPEPYCPDMTEV
jgi:hypothetical protein